MRKTFILMTVCAVAAMAAPSAYAACGFSVPVSNLIGSYIGNCPDNSPVYAYAYQANSPATVHSATIDIACEGLNAAQGCNQVLPVPNTPGDGNVTIETDWSTPGFAGCIAGNRVIVVLQCNDGSGVKLSLAGTDGGFGYELELAFEFDPSTEGVFPLQLKHPNGTPRFNNGRPQVLGLTRGGGNDIYNVRVPPGDLQHDCLADGGTGNPTLGFLVDQANGTLNCSGAPPPVPGRGRVFKRTQPCSFRPGPGAGLVGWTEDTAPLDANGEKAITMPTQTAASGMCNYLGTTSNLGGTDSGTIDGYSIIAPQDAASPVAENAHAGKKGNAVEISFSTSSELGLAGFNVLTGSKGKGELKLNGALIQSKGAGSGGASYTLSFPIGDFKGGRNVIIESVLTDGTTLRAPAINF